MTATALTVRERDVLDFEALTWNRRAVKEGQILARFQISPARYYQLVNALLDRREALAYSPTVVNRLRRVRDARARRLVRR